MTSRGQQSYHSVPTRTSDITPDLEGSCGTSNETGGSQSIQHLHSKPSSSDNPSSTTAPQTGPRRLDVSSPTQTKRKRWPLQSFARQRRLGFALCLAGVFACAVLVYFVKEGLTDLNEGEGSGDSDGSDSGLRSRLIRVADLGLVNRHPLVSRVVAFTLLASVMLFGVPTTPLEVTYGYLFGWSSLFISIPSKILGSLIFYSLATSGVWEGWIKPPVEKFETYRVFSSIIHEAPFQYSLLLRLAALPMVVKNYSLILLKIPFATYATTLAISVLPYSALSCSLGVATQAVTYSAGDSKGTSNDLVDDEPKALLLALTQSSSLGPENRNSFVMLGQGLAVGATILFPLLILRRFVKRRTAELLYSKDRSEEAESTRLAPASSGTANSVRVVNEEGAAPGKIEDA